MSQYICDNVNIYLQSLHHLSDTAFYKIMLFLKDLQKIFAMASICIPKVLKSHSKILKIGSLKFYAKFFFHVKGR